MNRKRLVRALAAVVAVVVAAAAWKLTHRTPRFQAVYDELAIGMPAGEVERRLGGLTSSYDAAATGVVEQVRFEWEGAMPGGIERVRLRSFLELRIDPTYAKARLRRTDLREEMIEAGQAVIRDTRTGAPVGQSFKWNHDEAFAVLYENGRLVEKCLSIRRVRPAWLAWLEQYGPF
jgi:hypothetical protein